MYRQDCGVLCSQCIKCVCTCTCSAAEIGQLKDAVQTKARDLDKANKVSQERSSQRTGRVDQMYMYMYVHAYIMLRKWITSLTVANGLFTEFLAQVVCVTFMYMYNIYIYTHVCLVHVSVH